MQSFIMNSHEVFIHIHQGCFAGTGAIVRLPQCQWSKPDGYGKIRQCITTTKHSKAKTVCIFLGIYCMRCRLDTGNWINVEFDVLIRSSIDDTVAEVVAKLRNIPDSPYANRYDLKWFNEIWMCYVFTICFLTHLPLVPHLRVRELGQHRFR